MKLVVKSLVKLVKSDYGLSLLGKVLSIVIGLLSSIFYIRYLGIEFKGEYSYINEISSIAALILNFGIYQSYPYYYRRLKQEVYAKYVKIFSTQFVVYSIIVMTLFFLPNNTLVVKLVLIQIPVLVLKTQLDNIVLIERFRLFVIMDIIYKSALCLFYFFLWLFADSSLIYMVIGVTIINLVFCELYLLFTRRIKLEFKLDIDVAFLKDVIKFGFFPMLSALLLTLNYSADIIFLRILGDSKELSLYSTAAIVINYVWIFPNAFKDVLIGQVARKYDENRVAFSVKISLFITMIVFIVFLILGKLAIRIVFGKDFIGCYEIILVLFLGTFSMIFFKMFGTVFVTEGKRVLYFVILLISVIANLIANYVLIPILGMYGAGISSVVSYDICGIAFLIAYCRYKKTKISQYFIFTRKDIAEIKKKI